MGRGYTTFKESNEKLPLLLFLLGEGSGKGSFIREFYHIQQPL